MFAAGTRASPAQWWCLVDDPDNHHFTGRRDAARMFPPSPSVCVGGSFSKASPWEMAFSSSGR